MTPVKLLGVFNYALVLLFGLRLSVAIAGGCQTRRQRRIMTALAPLFLLIQSPCWLILGVPTVKQLYPLIVHLPLTLALIFVLRKPALEAVVCTCTAYLCCQLPRWVDMAVTGLSRSDLLGEISYTLCIGPILWCLLRWFVRSAREAMTCSRTALLLFGSLPVTYYVFDYATTIYSDVLYSGLYAVNEFLPTVLILFYVLFLTAYHVQTQQMSRAEMQTSMLESQLKQSQLEMDALRRSETQTAVYQHDMRHHLNMIDGLLAAGKPEQAAAYIHSVRADIEAVTPRHFCENETVGLLCSSFADKAQRMGVLLTVKAKVPRDLPVSDTELCSVLSNGLENALRAVSKLPEGERWTALTCDVRLNKLRIQIRNPYSGELVLRDGLPVSDREGHGYGCQSIQAIARRRGGLCEFSASGGVFQLQFMLPVKPA